MKRNHIALLSVVLAIILWVYFNKRQGGVEVYTVEEIDNLIKYIERESEIIPEYVKTKLEEISDDEEFIMLAYELAKELAKADERTELSDFIYQITLDQSPA
jgi:hypothetical protein|tara:strand:+ start:1352 stop:1657 length:306 start_codon:yes stop_codon:yes gene_type:complete